MLIERKDKIQLGNIPGKGVCLSLWSEDINKIEMFKGLCTGNLPRALNWFHQCNTRYYQMFEFWKPVSSAMTEIAQKIATEMNIELIIDLDQIYNEGVTLTLDEFRSWEDCEAFHCFDNFFG